ncbi:hypothetical protein [Paracoccus aerius]|uniref:hypothetical protein n=1 Tax=Paracoccus aerius TaxID=1915382 RepID=UPI00174ADB4E|nr:hypothetical protein [Paracoccus aerius]
MGDVFIAVLMVILLLIVIYLAIFNWTNLARAGRPKACEAYRSECTAVMQGLF